MDFRPVGGMARAAAGRRAALIWCATRADHRRWTRGWRAVPTILLVLLGWVLFRAPDLGGAVALYQGMFGRNGLGISPALL